MSGRQTLWTTVAAGIAALVLLSGASGAGGGVSQSQVRAACAGLTSKMVCYHEQARRQYSLALLQRSTRLDRAARLKADRIVHCRRFTHQPCGDSFVRPFRLVGYIPWRSGWLVGENLAYGFGTPWAAFDGLMHSPRHRENILDRTFREIGVAERRSPWGPLWVLEYGRHL